MHTQVNYWDLKEGQDAYSQVQIGHYAFFKFTLLDAHNVKNITFNLQTLHGDSDLFISRKETFPSKSRYEKQSESSSGSLD